MAYDKVIEDGIEYLVTYRSDKDYIYAKAIIKGFIIEGYGKERETAFWSLEQKIFQTFHFGL
jgi:hypothetical protein